MDYLSIGEYNFLIFIIPGFLTVWSFRYFTESKKKGDFEFLGLSFIWGLIMLIIFQLINKKNYPVERLLSNPYAAAVVLSLFGFISGWLGNQIIQWKWFRKLINFLKSKW
jgi:peptidoglycan/LPS O-acetylase OafA/YrhL